MFLSQDRPKPADLLQPLCDLLFSVYRSDDLKSRWLWPVCMFGHIIYGGFISGNLPSSFFPHCATSTCRAAAPREDRYKEDMQEFGKKRWRSSVFFLVSKSLRDNMRPFEWLSFGFWNLYHLHMHNGMKLRGKVLFSSIFNLSCLLSTRGGMLKRWDFFLPT